MNPQWNVSFFRIILKSKRVVSYLALQRAAEHGRDDGGGGGALARQQLLQLRVQSANNTQLHITNKNNSHSFSTR